MSVGMKVGPAQHMHYVVLERDEEIEEIEIGERDEASAVQACTPLTLARKRPGECRLYRRRSGAHHSTSSRGTGAAQRLRAEAPACYGPPWRSSIPATALPAQTRSIDMQTRGHHGRQCNGQLAQMCFRRYVGHVLRQANTKKRHEAVAVPIAAP